MVHVSIGGMTVRSFGVLPGFVWNTYRALRAARRAPGCIDVQIFRQGRLYFALSVWDDADAMKAYAHTDVHAYLMTRIRDYTDFFKNVSYTADAPPSAAEAEAHWRGITGR